VENNPADALLLSGGIDSSVLAALDPKTPAITVVLEGQGVDLRHAQEVTEYLGTPWYPIEITRVHALQDLREIMQLTGSYDPAINNDIPVYEGLKYAASRGYRTIRTGDAADTLFTGYSYLQQEGINTREYLQGLIPQIRLASSRVGREMGMKMSYPYLYEEVLDFAQFLNPEDNTALLPFGAGDYTQLSDPTQAIVSTWGKIPLRNAAYGLLPNEIIWRIKTDLQFGSGADTIENYLEDTVTVDEVEEMKRSGKKFWNKYHGKLYLMYQDMGLQPTPPQGGEYSCPWCGGGILEGRGHCHTCGYHKSVENITTTFVKEYPEDH
jgi:asparagine synthase (glutamine-hydrolysing)